MKTNSDTFSGFRGAAKKENFDFWQSMIDDWSPRTSRFHLAALACGLVALIFLLMWRPAFLLVGLGLFLGALQFAMAILFWRTAFWHQYIFSVIVYGVFEAVRLDYGIASASSEPLWHYWMFMLIILIPYAASLGVLSFLFRRKIAAHIGPKIASEYETSRGIST